MPVNSSALKRFQVYDKCLRSIRRDYTREDILNELAKEEKRGGSKASGEKAGSGIAVNDRQFYQDLKTIEEEWGIEIERNTGKGRNKIYRYKNPGFSIFAHQPKDNYLIRLRDTLFVLQQFRGLPHFDFLNDLFREIEEADGRELEQRIIVDFDGNPELKGLGHFSMLLTSIQLRKAIKIKYRAGFRKAHSIILSPYFLKEYGNRWFLMGSEKGYRSVSCLALDRIESLAYAEKEKFTETGTDFEKEYFEDVIGTTVPKNGKAEKIVLKFSKERFDYVESKPLHGSQRSDRKKRLVTIEVIPNRELESLILHYGNDVEVLEPESLRSEIMARISTMNGLYKKEDH